MRITNKNQLKIGNFYKFTGNSAHSEISGIYKLISIEKDNKPITYGLKRIRSEYLLLRKIGNDFEQNFSLDPYGANAFYFTYVEDVTEDEVSSALIKVRAKSLKQIYCSYDGKTDNSVDYYYKVDDKKSVCRVLDVIYSDIANIILFIILDVYTKEIKVYEERDIKFEK